MATFECKVYKLKIEEHPNADALELAVVGDYRSIVRKGQFKTGDLGIYIPEAAIVPDWLIEKLGLVGKLAGKNKNRVKAVKLRGILSQGLVLPLDKYPFHTDIDRYGHDYRDEIVGVELPGDFGATVKFAPEGTDVTEFLGITKYEPPIPTQMAGEVFNAFGHTLHYDIENIKKYPDAFFDDDDVVITEKLHGTWCCFGFHPEVDSLIITSKGLSGKGLAFKLNEANENNLYIRALNKTADQTGSNIIDRAAYAFGGYDKAKPFYILGEVYGPGVQDLTYGATDIQFRVFDVYQGEPGKGSFFDEDELQMFCDNLVIERVPVLYRGPYKKEIVDMYTNGMETVSGKSANIREGVIVASYSERRPDDPELNRLKLKSVSEAYLLRKNGTEYN